MAALFDLVAMTVSSAPGTGATISLGSAATLNNVTYLSFATSGVAGGTSVDYSILDTGASEIGTAIYLSSGPFLGTRTPTKSTNGNAAISASSAAIILCSPRAETLNNAALFTGGTLLNSVIPVPSTSALGGVQAVNTVTNQWINAISSLGVPALTQPAFSNLSSAATLAQIASISSNTVLGNVGAAGSPSALTQTQLTSLVNAFSSALSGAAPASGGGTTNFLRADASWAAPAGGITPPSVTNTVSAATYTFVLTDAGKEVTFNSLSGGVVTIPTNASVAFPVPTVIFLTNSATSPLGTAISGASGVTLRGNNAVYPSPATFGPGPGGCFLMKIGTNIWIGC